MKIASFNVNSLKARLTNLNAWLQTAEPDIVCLQETKSTDVTFPREVLQGLGYYIVVHGQKTYNGVAILSKYPIEDVTIGLPKAYGDDHARYIEIVVVPTRSTVLRISSIYLPNGNPIGTEKFTYKLTWMDRLKRHAEKLLSYEEVLILAGDYNIVPNNDDVYSPAAWKDDALFQIESRMRLREIINIGFTDAFRACHTEPHCYTFWSYQASCWQKNQGARIDHILLSPQAVDRLRGCGIDQDIRDCRKPSDHVPIWINLEF
jgi:exodeoxyribonuclease-3